MNVDYTLIESGLQEQIPVYFEYTFSKEELENTSLLKLNCIVDGILMNEYDKLKLSINIKGKMVLPCSISLKPVDYTYSIDFDDYLDNLVKKRENTIDIFPIIWENILTEVPLKVVSSDLSDVVTEGDGWKLITEKKEETNPALEKLKDLL